MDLPGADNGAPRTLLRPNGSTVNVTCGNGEYVCHGGGRSYSTWTPGFGVGKDVNPNLYPYSSQTDANAAADGVGPEGWAIQMFSPEQIPVKAAIAKEFGVFNKFFSAVPAASTPNRANPELSTINGSPVRAALLTTCSRGSRSVHPVCDVVWPC
jgi:hypothetical protein